MKNKKQIKKTVNNPVKTVAAKAFKVVKKAKRASSEALINFRAPKEERRVFQANAKKFAKGNMSAWLRYAGANFTPKDVPKDLGLVRPSSR